jgi:hypothetical protein
MNVGGDEWHTSHLGSVDVLELQMQALTGVQIHPVL